MHINNYLLLALILEKVWVKAILKQKVIIMTKYISRVFNKPIENFTNVNFVMQSITRTMKDLPLSILEFDESIREGKSLLSKYFDINLTDKRINKTRDFFCELNYGLKGGFQQYLAIRDNVFCEAINLLEKSKNLPEVLYLVREDGYDALFKLTDENIDISINKNKFSNADELIVSSDDEFSSSCFSELTSDELNIISHAYVLNEVAIDIGNLSCGESDGFGCEHNDLEYIRDQFGINTTCQDRFLSVDRYHAVSNEDSTIMLLTVARTSNENIDFIIRELKTIQSKR